MCGGLVISSHFLSSLSYSIPVSIFYSSSSCWYPALLLLPILSTFVLCYIPASCHGCARKQHNRPLGCSSLFPFFFIFLLRFFFLVLQWWWQAATAAHMVYSYNISWRALSVLILFSRTCFHPKKESANKMWRQFHVGPVHTYSFYIAMECSQSGCKRRVHYNVFHAPGITYVAERWIM